MPYRPPDRILSALLLEKARIVELIGNIIDHSFRAAHYSTGGAAGEVDRMLYFFVEGVPALESSLRLILRPYGVRVTISTVFCHGTPKVVSTSPVASKSSCELADITFLATYGQVINNTGLGNALMTQAKNRLGETGSDDQELLYEQTDGFDYTSPRALSTVALPNTKSRLIAEAANALWYWTFTHPRNRTWSSHPHRWETYGVLARSRHTSHSFFTPFALTLFDLFAGINGRGFHKILVGSTEEKWSRVIDDLLRVTARTLVNGRVVAFLTRNGEQLRGEEARQFVAAVAGPDAAFLARCSIGEVFARIDKEMKSYGEKIEAANEAFDLAQFRRDFWKGKPGEKPSDGKGGGEPPILGNKRREFEEGEDGGGSFIVFEFQSLDSTRSST